MSILVGMPYEDLLPEEKETVGGWFSVFEQMTSLGVSEENANEFLRQLWGFHLQMEVEGMKNE